MHLVTCAPCVPNPVIAPHRAEKPRVFGFIRPRLCAFVPDVIGVIPGLALHAEIGFRAKLSVGCGEMQPSQMLFQSVA
jgi:hypothetical protein